MNAIALEEVKEIREFRESFDSCLRTLRQKYQSGLIDDEAALLVQLELVRTAKACGLKTALDISLKLRREV